jgi:hypothetical protein
MVRQGGKPQPIPFEAIAVEERKDNRIGLQDGQTLRKGVWKTGAPGNI